MQRDLEKTLIDEDTIARRIVELGREIAQDLGDLPDDDEIVLVPILTGSIIFVADLMRQLPLKLRIGLMTVSSYPGKSTTARAAEIVSDLDIEVRGKHVLVVDDILDSGQTIRLIRAALDLHEPRSVRACVLLRKQIPSAMETPCEYVGFDIGDEFVVGYGLDYDNYYRNLPQIGTLKPEAM